MLERLGPPPRGSREPSRAAPSGTARSASGSAYLAGLYAMSVCFLGAVVIRQAITTDHGLLGRWIRHADRPVSLLSPSLSDADDGLLRSHGVMNATETRTLTTDGSTPAAGHLGGGGRLTPQERAEAGRAARELASRGVHGGVAAVARPGRPRRPPRGAGRPVACPSWSRSGTAGCWCLPSRSTAVRPI